MNIHKAISLLIISLAVFLVQGCSSINYRKEADRFLNSTPEKVKVRRPVPEEWTLSNGLKVLYLKDDELPIVYGNLFIRGGSLYEDSKHRGVVSTMGSMLRLGGAGKYSPEALDERLRELAAGIGSSIGQEYGTISFNALSPDFACV